MRDTFIDQLLPTLTWTLVHSLWQGMLLTVLAGVVLLLTRRTTAAMRYRVLCTLFFCFLGGVGFTFLAEWRQALEPAPATSKVAVTGDAFSLFSLAQWRVAAAFFLDQNAPWIVLAWSLALLFPSGRLVREMVTVKKLRHHPTATASPFWRERTRALAAAIGICKTVLLVESAMVQVPVVVGHLKPVVMVPLGLLNHLSPAEAEAVLLHELAHIRRHDYLVNYLQRLAETLLFFNPGVWWVSSLLRAEREACCDEIAICHTGSKRQFVEALIRCKEHALETPVLSLGLFGHRNLLLRRLNRIVSNRNQTLSRVDASFVGASILVLTLVLSGWKEQPALWKPAVPIPVAATEGPGREVVAQLVVSSLREEKKPLATGVRAVPAVSSTRRAKPPKKQRREIVSLLKATAQRRNDRKGEPLQLLVAELNTDRVRQRAAEREEAEQRKVQVDLYRLQVEDLRKQAGLDRAAAEQVRRQAARDREKANEDRKQAETDRLRANKERLEAQKRREQMTWHWQPVILQ